ncbi:class F sortase [Xylanimonas protaetiae]|uniref:Class F sortase n=1 Tax=Xylanimonas protaetiae TaxID=2509457 RepID=A0A4P6F058_9MICO|nr:class F sortase [Xylanimonas protaetiae]QAY69120.1 class F sortase [Xylanimonas protaetiae]
MSAPAPEAPRRRRPSAGRVVALLFAAACLVGAGVLASMALRPAPGGLVDLSGNRVVLDDVPDVAAADPVALPEEGSDGAGRFVAPRQGLDVPLVAMNVVDGVINPPTLTDAFLVRGHGTPQEPGSGLVVLAMHAVRGGNAPGNAFFAMEAAESPVTVEVGDVLLVDGVAYTVTGHRVMSKDDAASSAEVWGDPAGRDGELVLITCLQRQGESGSATDNLVVFARAS